MQTLYEQQPTHNWSSQSRMIAVVAMLLFALSGLISGFAVGAFIRPALHNQSTNPNSGETPPVKSQGATPTRTPRTQHPIPLGIPQVGPVSYTEASDDTTTYTTTLQVTDQSNGNTTPGKPVHAPGITCKIWLTKDGHVNANMPIDRLQAVDTLSQPFPKEKSAGLDFFDPSTPQTQMCNARGQATWNYKVPSTVEPGRYFLVALTDWNGIHYNWSWAQITVTKSK